MHCPKCNHEQRDARECESCGLIFTKYNAVQKRKKEAEAQKIHDAGKRFGRGLKFVQIVLLAAVVASTTYYFFGRKGGNQLLQSAPDKTVAQKDESVKVEKRLAQKVNDDQTSSQLVAFKGNAVALAGKATVSIETPWGTGSGFFISEYYIVTNRHVIEVDKDRMDEFRKKIETARRLIDLEEQRLKNMRNVQ